MDAVVRIPFGLACVLDPQLLIFGVALLQVQHQATQALCRQRFDLWGTPHTDRKHQN
jgi:hypothetical protein